MNSVERKPDRAWFDRYTRASMDAGPHGGKPAAGCFISKTCGHSKEIMQEIIHPAFVLFPLKHPES